MTSVLTTASPTSVIEQRKTKDGLELEDLLKLKVGVIKAMCYAANVGVTGKKDVLAERLLDPSKHQLTLLRQEVMKALRDQMVYDRGMSSKSISWHRAGVTWAAFSANFGAAKRPADGKTATVHLSYDNLPAKGLRYGGSLECSYAEVKLSGEILAVKASYRFVRY